VRGEFGGYVRDRLQRGHVLGEPVKAKGSEAESRPASSGSDLQVSCRAQELDMWRQVPLAEAQRDLDGDLFLSARVCQHTCNEQPGWKKQPWIKITLKG
jgi:hypothetical protein